jgi:O-antigen ligase
MKSAAVTTLRGIPSSGHVVTWGRRLMLGGTGGILIFAPLAYGAVHPWAYFSVGLAVTALSLALLGIGLYEVGARPTASWFLPYPPLWLLGVGLVFLVLAQVSPLPQGVVHRLSPAAWKIRALGNGLGLADYLPLSLNPYATLRESMKVWPALVLFFILIYTVNSRRQIVGLVGLILAVALFEVFYGYWHFGRSLIWGWPNPYSGLRLCGTFINSNHLAMFLTMAILLGYGLFLAQGRPAPQLPPGAVGRSRLQRWSRAEHLEPQLRRLLLLFLLLLLTVGLIFTGSRGGMISLAVGFALMALLIRGQQWPKSHLLLIAVFLAAAVLYSLLLGGAWHLARFQKLMDPRRYHEMKGAVAIFRDYPWLGSGIGTFGDLSYRFQPVEFQSSHFVYTHSDWLQLLAEGGLLGFIMFVGAWALFFSALINQWRRRSHAFPKYLGLGGLAAMGAGIFHSLVEFPFHIPALSLLFAAVAAITYLTIHWQPQGGEYFSYPTLRFPGRRQLAMAVLLSLLGLQLAFGLNVGRFWLAERAAPTERDSTRPAVTSGVEDFSQALALNPRNSKYYAGLAEALQKDGGLEGKNLGEVEAALKKAIFLSPGYWGYHFKLAEFYLGQQARAPYTYVPQALKEFQAAAALFPEYAILHFRLAAVLDWAERLDSALVPGGLREAGGLHLQEALRLDPQLKRFWRQPGPL